LKEISHAPSALHEVVESSRLLLERLLLLELAELGIHLGHETAAWVAMGELWLLLHSSRESRVHLTEL